MNGSVFHSMWPVSLLGCGPSSVTPYGVPPSPWGKASSGGGFLPAGRPLTFPWGKVARRSRDGRGAVPGRFCLPPHTRQGLWPCHPLPGEGRGILHPRPCHPLPGEGRGFFEILRKKPFTFGNTYGRISPLVMASITFVPSAQLREKTQGGISPNPILS